MNIFILEKFPFTTFLSKELKSQNFVMFGCCECCQNQIKNMQRHHLFQPYYSIETRAMDCSFVQRPLCFAVSKSDPEKILMDCCI